LTIEKMVELAAIPSPIETIAATAMPGDLRLRRNAWVTSP
jgi:hypothetical protein